MVTHALIEHRLATNFYMDINRVPIYDITGYLHHSHTYTQSLAMYIRQSQHDTYMSIKND